MIASLALSLGVALAGPVQPLKEDWPLPVHERQTRYMIVADQLEWRAPGVPGQLGADVEGWFGQDFDRLRFRAEGDLALAGVEVEGEAALLYSRLVSPWLELQIGVGGEALSAASTGGEARVEAGIEYVVPYDVDLEAHLRISYRGRASVRVSAVKELRFTQRLILQLRADVTASAQEAPSLGQGRWLPAAGAGARMRYEARREVAPYLGFNWTGGATNDGSAEAFTHAAQGVAGIRVWY